MDTKYWAGNILAEGGTVIVFTILKWKIKILELLVMLKIACKKKHKSN